MADIYTTIDGDTLDWICWRFYGRQSVAAEAVLAANPGLAAHGVDYEAGMEITLPVLSVPKRAPMRLWE